MSGKRNTKNNFFNEKGSHIVEAAIILPIFILAAVTIIVFIRAFEGSWKINHAIKEEVGLSLARAYVMAYDPLLNKRIKDNLYEIDNVALVSKHVNQSLNKAGYDNLVKAKIKYVPDFNLPLMNKNFGVKEAFAFGRKFIGDKREKKIISFDQMEKDEESNIVYIFPRDGERFHKANCYQVAPKAEKIILNKDLSSRYKPCQVCLKKSLSDGDTTLIFRGYGDRYHRSQCSFISRQIERIERETAQEKSYTPCQICKP